MTLTYRKASIKEVKSSSIIQKPINQSSKMPPSTEALRLIWKQPFAILPWQQPFTILLPLTLFLLFLYKWLHQKPSKTLPPSPPRLPIIGNLHQLGTCPHRSFKSLSEKYGDLMLLHIGKSPVLIVSSSKSAQKIMKTLDIVFSDRPTSKAVHKLVYNGRDLVFAPYGEHWRQMKSICLLQLLSNSRVRSFRSVREEEAALLIKKLVKNSTSSSSSVVNLSEIFMDFTSNVICRIALGRKYSGDEAGISFKKVMVEVTELVGTFRVGDFIPWLAWIDLVNGSDSKVDKVAKEFDWFLEKIVTEHQDCHGGGHSREDEDSKNDVVKDIVDVLLDVQTENATGFTLDRDIIKGLILDIFSGGTDTTSTVLEWAMTELLRHPIVMEQLQKEVRENVGEKLYVSEDDLEQMKYLKAVIKETLRLHPPLPLVPRQSTEDAKINGYDIPASAIVLINAWAIHRDPASWDEPEKFNPERFMNSPTEHQFRGQDFDFIPFGAGRRICPGITFTIANNELALANLVHKFNWRLPGGETLDMSECIGTTARKKIPLHAIATPIIANN